MRLRNIFIDKLSATNPSDIPGVSQLSSNGYSTSGDSYDLCRRVVEKRVRTEIEPLGRP